MKKIILLLILANSLNGFSQEKEISDLENLKTKLLDDVVELNDSIKKIEYQIIAIKSHEIKKMISDSALTAIVKKGAKLRKSASPLGELIATLSEDKKVIILDYHNDYFGVCTDSICGYMNDLWIKSNDRIDSYIQAKKAEQKQFMRLQQEQKLKKEKAEWAELEKKYLKKYGQKTYNKLKDGYYWIGMNREMATIALGNPNDINRTVGSWGIHEQWIYDNIYLYFENGKLTSYQN